MSINQESIGLLTVSLCLSPILPITLGIHYQLRYGSHKSALGEEASNYEIGAVAIRCGVGVRMLDGLAAGLWRRSRASRSRGGRRTARGQGRDGARRKPLFSGSPGTVPAGHGN